MVIQRREALGVLALPESNGRQASGLTAKMEWFCRMYLATGNASEAYRLAYDVGPTTKPQTVYTEAYRLLGNPYVTPRIEELRDQAVSELRLTPEHILSNLMREAEDGTGIAGKMSRIRALELLGRHLGLFDTRRKGMRGASPVTVTYKIGNH